MMTRKPLSDARYRMRNRYHLAMLFGFTFCIGIILVLLGYSDEKIGPIVLGLLGTPVGFIIKYYMDKAAAEDTNGH